MSRHDSLRRMAFVGTLLSLLTCTAVEAAAPSGNVADYPSLQAALDANRGRMLYLPPGDYEISERLKIVGAGSGLFGHARIIQTDPEQPIIVFDDVRDGQLRDVTLTRPEGKTETRFEGVMVNKSRDVVIDNVRVVDNRTRAAGISLRDCANCRIVGCTVRNYRRTTIEDRATVFNGGYAFQCLDGSGITVFSSIGTLVQGNRIVEEELLPTPEVKEKYGLGKFVRKNAEKPARTPQATWDAEYTDNWNQGSALVVSSPEVSDRTRILGNSIENAAQGIDLHTDHAIVSGNIVVNCFIGMKAMHGSRNVAIVGNQFIKNDLWAIGLMPGAAAHGVQPDAKTEAARGPNTDGGSVIADNIISDFGYGTAHWMWGDERSPLKFDEGQLEDDPPLTDVVVRGNVVYDPGRQRDPSGKPIAGPRYRYAVIIAQGESKPVGLKFSGNLFHPGSGGVANVELEEK